METCKLSCPLSLEGLHLELLSVKKRKKMMKLFYTPDWQFCEGGECLGGNWGGGELEHEVSW